LKGLDHQVPEVTKQNHYKFSRDTGFDGSELDRETCAYKSNAVSLY